MPLRNKNQYKLFGSLLIKLFFIISLIYIVLFLAYITLAALGTGLSVDTYAANGTFQLFNPLRRISEGQLVAKDFPFFHGVGVPWLHYPIFKVLGENLFATEVAKWLVSPLLFVASSLIFYLAFFKRFNLAIVATALFTILSIYSIDVIYPGNSLVGVRTVFPLLVGAYMLLKPDWKLTFRNRTFSLYYPVLYVLMGLSFACGTEQGLALLIAYLIIRTIQLIRHHRNLLSYLKIISIEIACLVLSTLLILAIFTGGYPFEALHYALLDIPKDQGWYFGTAPNGTLAWNTLDYLFEKRLLVYMAPVILGGGIALVFAYRKKIITPKQLFAFSVLITYGVVVFIASATGYWAPSTQLIPLTRVLGVIFVALFLNYCITTRKNKWMQYLTYFIVSIVIIITFSHSINTFKQLSYLPFKHIFESSREARHGDDYSVLSQNWKDRVDTFSPLIPEGSTIWSTYTSVYDSLADKLNPSSGGEDYIIHALGEKRRENYTQDFVNSKPDFAITLRPNYFLYEEWLWDRHWSFYTELLTDYTLVAENDSHLLWKRADTLPKESIASQINSSITETSNGVFSLKTAGMTSVSVHSVTVRYSIKKPLVVGDKLSRYVLEINNSPMQRYPVSLPPYETEWTFPVIATPGENNIEIRAKVYGLINQGLTIDSISSKALPVSTINSYLFYDNYCAINTPKGTGLLACTKDPVRFEVYKIQPSVTNFSLNSGR